MRRYGSLTLVYLQGSHCHVEPGDLSDQADPGRWAVSLPDHATFMDLGPCSSCQNLEKYD
jgi:hypothetical protein